MKRCLSFVWGVVLVTALATSCGDRSEDPLSPASDETTTLAINLTVSISDKSGKGPNPELPLFKMSFFRCKDGSEGPDCGQYNYKFKVLCYIPANEINSTKVDMKSRGWFFHFLQQIPPGAECIPDLVFRPPGRRKRN